MTFHGKTYTNGFPFLNGSPFTQAVWKPLAKKLHPFERLGESVERGRFFYSLQ